MAFFLPHKPMPQSLRNRRIRAGRAQSDYMENLMTKNLLALALAASMVLPVTAYADDAAPQRRIVVIGEGQARRQQSENRSPPPLQRESRSAPRHH